MCIRDRTRGDLVETFKTLYDLSRVFEFDIDDRALKSYLRKDVDWILDAFSSRVEPSECCVDCTINHLEPETFDDLRIDIIPCLDTVMSLVNTAVFTHLSVFFQACVRKRQKPQATWANDEVICELDFPVNDADTSFETFFQRSEQQITSTIEEHRERFGYVYIR